MSEHTQQIYQEITRTAKENGAILVGSTKIRREEPVILFGFPFTDTWFFSRPFSISKYLGETYRISKHVQDLTAEILKREGYRAEYKTVFSVFGDFRPLVVSAGMGEWGRNGLVVNKKYGSGLLFAGIFTDPSFEVGDLLSPEMVRDSASITRESHCSECGQCIQACPTNAFEGGKFHYSRCVPQAMKGCGECLKSCQARG